MPPHNEGNFTSFFTLPTIISTDEDPSLRIESSAIINLRGVSTKLNKYIVFTMQTYKKLNIGVLARTNNELHLMGLSKKKALIKI